MSYPKVDPKCQLLHGQCHHWVTSFYEDKPWLASAEVLLTFADTLTPELRSHLQSNNVQSNGCSNPFNLINNESERQALLATRPQRKVLPHSKDRVSTTTHIMSLAEVKKAMLEDIGADCWCVYTRNPQTHEPQHVYFESDGVVENPQDAIVRTNLLSDINPLVHDLNQGNDVCIIMGGNAFIDFYYRKIGDQFLSVAIR